MSPAVPTLRETMEEQQQGLARLTGAWGYGIDPEYKDKQGGGGKEKGCCLQIHMTGERGLKADLD